MLMNLLMGKDRRGWGIFESMKISKIIIEKDIEEKIFYKHSIPLFEIEEALFSNPYILKTRESRLVAINWFQKYITIIFELRDNKAFIITAYPSSDAQRKLYKRKR